MSFNDVTLPVARKQHRCEWCGEAIEKGEKHAKYVGMFEGDFQSWRMHQECSGWNTEAISEGFTPYENERVHPEGTAISHE